MKLDPLDEKPIRELASLQPPPPEMQQLFGALRHNQEQTDRFFGVIAGTTPFSGLISSMPSSAAVPLTRSLAAPVSSSRI